MYAVIALKGHQYIVSEDATLVVDSVDQEVGTELEIKEVLATFDEKGEKVHVGAPYLAKASVVCEVTSHQQGEKMRITKFVRKNRYQRTIGFRPQQTVLTIKKIHA